MPEFLIFMIKLYFLMGILIAMLPMDVYTKKTKNDLWYQRRIIMNIILFWPLYLMYLFTEKH